ncbi:BlaI/MecI/CopY family transcriptional regulator [Mycobacterium bourgelatii]|uniref:Transcriptional regulator BlaI n=1 Tax=Mycobacterium bourgelatii TaxID=1273442 RepID=A0A7I9YR70_MYCBU|nr:BlaI/MecI/CopY family transcriptional regulator [Mycobacterium bourgelatii]MCV6974348.1 BlaI/MecI/CopY family transcriptional regulator [Mycobacterium bourgelatii]GFG91190.1 hypothetical protein MBOU_32320 [Mycobacterium bourgelatii]
MPGLRPLGELEQAVMEELWKARSPQTGRHLHNALSVHRRLAYTTITTVLARLTAKGLVVAYRDERAHRYAPRREHGELVAELMAEALSHATDVAARRSALMRFVASVNPDDASALKCALAQVHAADHPGGGWPSSAC